MKETEGVFGPMMSFFVQLGALKLNFKFSLSENAIIEKVFEIFYMPKQRVLLLCKSVMLRETKNKVGQSHVISVIFGWME